jgi:hypothetical protein
MDSEGVNQYLKADGTKTNIPATADKTVQGQVNPSWTLGWNNNFSYGNWEANFLFTSLLGFDRLNLLRAIMSTNYTSVLSAIPTLSDGWYKSYDYLKANGGDTSKAEFATRSNPNNRNQQGDTNKFLERADFLRLRNLSIAYRIPRNVMRFADVRVSASAQNLLLITKYKGLDPETSNSYNAANTVDAHGGQDLGTFPNPRVFTLGLRIDF